jgi:uncharacterized protein (DUF2249 family)
MVIQASDRVDRVLARDERMVDAFVAVSPTFERLRNPMLRKTMARLVTVEQAARVAGVSVEELVGRLNEVLVPAGEGTGSSACSGGCGSADSTGASSAAEAGPLPRWVTELPAGSIVEVDVREDLRSGREPFRRIMSARAFLKPGQVLRLRAIFEPAPLYGVMARFGLASHVERLADDDWQITFYPDGSSPDGDAREPESPPCGEVPGAPDAVVIDVRGLEPPEPMVRTLAALETLPPGGTLVQINQRTPQFLLPQLESRGFRYEVQEVDPEEVRLIIRHADQSSQETP